jgi:hypothetical protein
VSHGVLAKIVLFFGWILFAASCLVSPVLNRLAWRYQVIASFTGPVLMFGGLILRRAAAFRRR